MAVESPTQTTSGKNEAPTGAPVMWLVSRSELQRGQQHCEFARWVEFRSGPFGMGFSRKAQSLPLTTGQFTHLGCTEVARWLMDARQKTGMQPDVAPDEVIRWAADMAVEEYRRVITASGLLQNTRGGGPRPAGGLSTTTK